MSDGRKAKPVILRRHEEAPPEPIRRLAKPAPLSFGKRNLDSLKLDYLDKLEDPKGPAFPTVNQLVSPYFEDALFDGQADINIVADPRRVGPVDSLERPLEGADLLPDELSPEAKRRGDENAAFWRNDRKAWIWLLAILSSPVWLFGRLRRGWWWWP